MECCIARSLVHMLKKWLNNRQCGTSAEVSFGQFGTSAENGGQIYKNISALLLLFLVTINLLFSCC